MTILVVLPAYNESENLNPLLESYVRLSRSGETKENALHYKVVVVDDGSTDETSKVAESFKDRLDIVVEKHPRNMGLGPALRTGLKATLSLTEMDKKAVVVTMDADNSHSPDLIPEMVQKIHEGYDVVIASRYVEGGRELGLAKYRSLLSAGCSWLLELFFPIKGAKDYTCGYRAMRVSILQKVATETKGIFFREDSFVCVSELLLNMHKSGARVFEVPLVLRYDLKKGASKMKVFPTIFRYFSMIFRQKYIS